MKKAILLALLLTLAVRISPAQSPPPAALDTSSLSPPERSVLEHLRRDWLKEYRTTSMSLAAEVTKTTLSDNSRLRLARFLEANKKAFPKVARYGVITVTLTPNEKLLARALLLRERRDKGGARLQDLAGDLQVSASSLERPLSFLQDLKVVVSEGEGPERRYRVAEGFPRRASFRIDFFSHRVEVNGSDKFEVAWAVDFLLLVNSTYLSDVVKIEDGCAHCLQRILMVIERGRVRQISPAQTLVFWGGAWGLNNLFSSEEHLKEWLQPYPELAQRERMPVQDFLTKRKKKSP